MAANNQKVELKENIIFVVVVVVAVFNFCRHFLLARKLPVLCEELIAKY